MPWSKHLHAHADKQIQRGPLKQAECNVTLLSDSRSMHLSMLKSQASTLVSSARGDILQTDAVGQRKVEQSSTGHDTAISHMGAAAAATLKMHAYECPAPRTISDSSPAAGNLSHAAAAARSKGTTSVAGHAATDEAAGAEGFVLDSNMCFGDDANAANTFPSVLASREPGREQPAYHAPLGAVAASQGLRGKVPKLGDAASLQRLGHCHLPSRVPVVVAGSGNGAVGVGGGRRPRCPVPRLGDSASLQKLSTATEGGRGDPALVPGFTLE